jgi:hypothetical protein
VKNSIEEDYKNLEELIRLLYQDNLTQFRKRQLVKIIENLKKENE